MRSKRRRYLILLLVSIAIRIFFFYFPFQDTFFEAVAKTHILYDVIFFSIMISLLELLEDRKWLISFTWIVLLVSIAYNIVVWLNDTYAPLTRHQLISTYMIMGFVFIIYYVCLFFARESPARIFFRCMPAVILIPMAYGIFAAILHYPGPYHWLSNRAGVAVISILLNTLLALAVLRAPVLREPEYADFLA